MTSCGTGLVNCNGSCIDVQSDNTNCGGCGMSTGLTMLGRALAGEEYSLVIPACCGIVTAGAFPTTSYGVPTVATTFASATTFSARLPGSS